MNQEADSRDEEEENGGERIELVSPAHMQGGRLSGSSSNDIPWNPGKEIGFVNSMLRVHLQQLDEADDGGQESQTDDPAPDPVNQGARQALAGSIEPPQAEQADGQKAGQWKGWNDPDIR